MGHGKALVGRDVVLLGVGILLAAVFGIAPAVATNPGTQSSGHSVPKGLELHMDRLYYDELLRVLQTPFHGKYMRQSVDEVHKLFANNPDFINKEFTPRLMYYLGQYSEKFHDRLGDMLLYYYKEYPHRNNPGADVWKEPNQNELITSRFLDFYTRARGLTKFPPPLRPNTGIGMGTSSFDFLFDASGAIMPPSRPAPARAPITPISIRFETIPPSASHISTAGVQIASTIQEESESDVVSVTDNSADDEIVDYYSAYSSFHQDAVADEMATSDDQNILAGDKVYTVSPSSIDINLAGPNDGLRPCISDSGNANPTSEAFSTQIHISDTEYGLERFLFDAAKADPVPDDLTYSDSDYGLERFLSDAAKADPVPDDLTYSDSGYGLERFLSDAAKADPVPDDLTYSISDYGLDQLFPDIPDAVLEDDNVSPATEMNFLNSDYSPEHIPDIKSTESELSPDGAISINCVGTILEDDEHQPSSDLTEMHDIAHHFESDDQRAQSNVNDNADNPVGDEPAPDLQSNEPDPIPNSDLAMSETESIPELAPSSNQSDPIHETSIQSTVDRPVSLHDSLHPELSPVDGQPLTATQIAADLHGFPDPDALSYQWSTEIGLMIGVFGILTLTVALLLFTETKVMPFSLENLDIEPREFHYTMANGAKIRVHTGIPDRSNVTF